MLYQENHDYSGGSKTIDEAVAAKKRDDRIEKLLKPSDKPPAEQDQTKEKKIEQITDLPDDSKSPNVSSIESTRFPILTISLSGGETYALLRQNALMIKAKLEKQFNN